MAFLNFIRILNQNGAIEQIEVLTFMLSLIIFTIGLTIRKSTSRIPPIILLLTFLILLCHEIISGPHFEFYLIAAFFVAVIYRIIKAISFLNREGRVKV